MFEDLQITCNIEQWKRSNIFSDVFADFRGLIISEDVIESIKPVDTNALDWGKEIADKSAGILLKENKYETTANYMLDGRAIYVSALGPQEPHLSLGRRVPVEYILCVQQNQEKEKGLDQIVNKWQLGRLVGRLHRTGTLRLAALADVDQLREAGFRLKILTPT